MLTDSLVLGVRDAGISATTVGGIMAAEVVPVPPAETGERAIIYIISLVVPVVIRLVDEWLARRRERRLNKGDNQK